MLMVVDPIVLEEKKESEPDLTPEIPNDCESALVEAFLNDIDPAEAQFDLEEQPIS